MSDFRFTIDTLRTIRRAAQEAKRNCEEIANALDEVEHVSPKTVSRYRGMSDAYAEIVEGLDQTRRDIEREQNND
jgi:hypothetical protein